MVSGATTQQLVTWLTYHRAIGEGGEKEREGGKERDKKEREGRRERERKRGRRKQIRGRMRREGGEWSVSVREMRFCFSLSLLRC